MDLNKEELMFISECLISYQETLLNMKKLTFGSVNNATHEQIEKISKLNNKIMNVVENKEKIRKD